MFSSRFKRTKVTASEGQDEEEEEEEREEGEESVDEAVLEDHDTFANESFSSPASDQIRHRNASQEEENILTQCGLHEIKHCTTEAKLCLLPTVLYTSLQHALSENNTDNHGEIILITKIMIQLENVLLREMKKLIMELEKEGIIVCPRLRWDGKSSSEEKTLIRRFGFLINAYHVRPFPPQILSSVALSLCHSLFLSLFRTHSPSPLQFFSLPRQLAEIQLLVASHCMPNVSISSVSVLLFVRAMFLMNSSNL